MGTLARALWEGGTDRESCEAGFFCEASTFFFFFLGAVLVLGGGPVARLWPEVVKRPCVGHLCDQDFGPGRLAVAGRCVGAGGAACYHRL